MGTGLCHSGVNMCSVNHERRWLFCLLPVLNSLFVNRTLVVLIKAILWCLYVPVLARLSLDSCILIVYSGVALDTGTSSPGSAVYCCTCEAYIYAHPKVSRSNGRTGRCPF